MRVRWNTYGINLLRETDIKRKIELTQIKRQIEILSTFMPDEILNMPLTELDEVHTYVGVLLFADVSGFTPLCEKYNKTGKGGIYRLTATLNAYIGALVEVITFYGGDILKFSGDAFLALWKAPPDLRLFEVIHKVIVCALFIQNTLGCFETEVNVLLKVKLAIACGNLTFSVIGNQSHRHYIITGQAISDVKCAERVSVSGDVVVAPSAWGHLAEDNYEVTYGPDGNVKVLVARSRRGRANPRLPGLELHLLPQPSSSEGVLPPEESRGAHVVRQASRAQESAAREEKNRRCHHRQ
jgi:class 3 adenylate cyclase